MQQNRQEPELGTEPMGAVPSAGQPKTAGAGGVWLFVLLSWLAGAAVFWWQQAQTDAAVQRLEQQLVATQDSFARVSESAAGRLLALSNQLEDMTRLEARMQALARQLEGLQQGFDSLQATGQKLGELEAGLRKQEAASSGQMAVLEEQLQQAVLTLAQAQDELRAQQQGRWEETLTGQQQLQDGLTFLQELHAGQDTVQDSMRTQLEALQAMTTLHEEQLRQLLSQLEPLQSDRQSLDELQQEMSAFRAQVTRTQHAVQQRLSGLEQQAVIER